MQIEITHLEHEDTYQWADSIAHSGLSDIGAVTWRNACEEAARRPLVTAEQQYELRAWIAGFGAWTRQEIAAMPDAETNALLIQLVSGDLEEFLANEGDAEWEANFGGRVFRDGEKRLWYYVGN